MEVVHAAIGAPAADDTGATAPAAARPAPPAGGGKMTVQVRKSPTLLPGTAAAKPAPAAPAAAPAGGVAGLFGFGGAAPKKDEDGKLGDVLGFL